MPHHHHPRQTHHHHATAGASTAAFVASAANAAKTSESRTGVPASITIAQAALESTWGRNHMGAANNYFGIKAQTHKDGTITWGHVATGSVEMPTTEQVGGKVVHIKAPFRSYASMADSFVDHGEFLKVNSRYASAIKSYAATGDADAFAEGLQKAGYATDGKYASKLISIMKAHNLYQYNATPPAKTK